MFGNNQKKTKSGISSSILAILSLFNKTLVHQKQVLYLAKVGVAIFFDLHPYIVAAPIGDTDNNLLSVIHI